MQYTAQKTNNGTYEIYRNGQRIGTGAASWAKNYVSDLPTTTPITQPKDNTPIPTPQSNNSVVSSGAARQDHLNNQTHVGNSIQYSDSQSAIQNAPQVPPTPQEVAQTDYTTQMRQQQATATTPEAPFGGYTDPIKQRLVNQGLDRIDSLTSSINSLTNISGADINLDGRIVALKRQYEEERTKMITKNNEIAANTSSALYKFGGFRYQSEAGSTAMSAEETAGIQRLTDLKNKYDSIIAKAREAIKSDNAKALRGLRGELDKVRSSLYTTVDKTIEQQIKRKRNDALNAQTQANTIETNQKIMESAAEHYARQAANGGIQFTPQELMSLNIDPQVYASYYASITRDITKSDLGNKNTLSQIDSRAYRDKIAGQQYNLSVMSERRKALADQLKTDTNNQKVQSELRLIDAGVNPDSVKWSTDTVNALFSRHAERMKTDASYAKTVNTAVNSEVSTLKKSNYYIDNIITEAVKSVGTYSIRSSGKKQMDIKDAIEFNINTLASSNKISPAQAEVLKSSIPQISSIVDKATALPSAKKIALGAAYYGLGGPVSLASGIVKNQVIDPIMSSVVEAYTGKAAPDKYSQVVASQLRPVIDKLNSLDNKKYIEDKYIFQNSNMVGQKINSLTN